MFDFVTHAGTTETITFQLQEINPVDHTVTAVNLTGYSSPILHLRNTASQDVVQYGSGKVDFGTRTNGEVVFAPSAGDLVAGKYEAYIQVTTTTGKIAIFPSERQFRIQVLESF